MGVSSIIGEGKIQVLAIAIVAISGVGPTVVRAASAKVPGACPAADQSFVLKSRPTDFTLNVGADEIKIGAYNVENLFDTVHNDGKEDFEFLPKSDPLKSECAKNPIPFYRKSCEDTDWIPSRLALKLSQIKRSLESQGVLPDILSLEEVENPNVVGMLAQVLGYKKFVMSTGTDGRGINVALLYKEEKITYETHQEYQVTLNGAPLSTRNILATRFKILESRFGKPTGQTLGIYSNHWPSQNNPSANRIAAAGVLKAAIDEHVAQYGKDKYFYVALGDFNTVEKENPNGFDTIADTSWQNHVTDIETIYRTDASDRDPQQLLPRMPPGSFYYGHGKQWNHLDHIFASANLLNGKTPELRTETFRIVASDLLFRPVPSCPSVQEPAPYDYSSDSSETAGFSDHLPLVVNLRLR